VIIDTDTGSYLNPLRVLPAAPDRETPVIRRIFVRRNGGMMEAVTGRRLAPGEAEILAEAYDPVARGGPISRRAPYRFALYVNGRTVSDVSFDSVRSENRRLVLGEAMRGFETVYHSTWIYRVGKVDFVRGETHVELVVSDFSGNEAYAELFFTVALD
jgi:hypothetical protein